MAGTALVGFGAEPRPAGMCSLLRADGDLAPAAWPPMARSQAGRAADDSDHAAAVTGVPPMPARSDRWTFCSQGHIHWGANGGAGLLLRYVPARGEPVYLLTERSRWADEGGTWGIPGGAIHEGEPVLAAARREAAEESGRCRRTGSPE
ncbi:MAG TPA: NUDIX domain-containing protein [Streptosporangiaceae bacterium]|nr:NUDIX domain-containing protein [Streptosporangiaceae bacterium]